MIVLDTQHDSQLQLTGTDSATRLVSRLKALRDDELRLTIITPFEQLRECLGRINASASRPTSQLAHYDRLSRILDFYAAWNARILPFNQAAADVLGRFPPQLIRRIGPQDSRIAAIGLANDATLLSANLRDFQQVPGLRVEDWLNP